MPDSILPRLHQSISLSLDGANDKLHLIDDDSKNKAGCMVPYLSHTQILTLNSTRGIQIIFAYIIK